MLKKYFAFFLLVFTVFMIWKSSYFTSFGGKTESYLYRNSSTAEITDDKVKTFFSLSTGESIIVNGEDYIKVLNDYEASIVFIEKAEGGESIYAYSDKINFLKVEKSKKVNMQIYVKNGNMKVGFPIIFGSY